MAIIALRGTRALMGDTAHVVVRDAQDSVIVEDMGLALQESTFLCLCLVIHFSKFLPVKKCVSPHKINSATVYLPRLETSHTKDGIAREDGITF
jgi:hypothetical protein